MEKNNLFLLKVVSIILVISSIIVAFNSDSLINRITNAEKIEKEFIEEYNILKTIETSERKDVYFSNTDFTIYESEIKKIDEQYKLTGILNGRERAIKFLLRREILYNESLIKGFYASEKEITDLIDLNIKLARNANNYKSDFLPFLNSLGMNDEEYWATQYDVFKKDITISKYASSITKESTLTNQEDREEETQNILTNHVNDYIIKNNIEFNIN